MLRKIFAAVSDVFHAPVATLRFLNIQNHNEDECFFDDRSFPYASPSRAAHIFNAVALVGTTLVLTAARDAVYADSIQNVAANFSVTLALFFSIHMLTIGGLKLADYLAEKDGVPPSLPNSYNEYMFPRLCKLLQEEHSPKL